METYEDIKTGGMGVVVSRSLERIWKLMSRSKRACFLTLDLQREGRPPSTMGGLHLIPPEREGWPSFSDGHALDVMMVKGCCSTEVSGVLSWS